MAVALTVSMPRFRRDRRTASPAMASFEWIPMASNGSATVDIQPAIRCVAPVPASGVRDPGLPCCRRRLSQCVDLSRPAAGASNHFKRALKVQKPRFRTRQPNQAHRTILGRLPLNPRLKFSKGSVFLRYDSGLIKTIIYYFYIAISVSNNDWWSLCPVGVATGAFGAIGHG